MGKKISDTRERFYDIRTGYQNLKYCGDTQHLARTFTMHTRDLQAFHTRSVQQRTGNSSAVGTQFVVRGLFKFTVHPMYCLLKKGDPVPEDRVYHPPFGGVTTPDGENGA